MDDRKQISEMADQLATALELPRGVDWRSVAFAIESLPRFDRRRARLGVLFRGLETAFADGDDYSAIRREILLILSKLQQ